MYFMEYLNSSWLLRMLEAGGKKPSEKILYLFTCLENWLDAPGIREQFKVSYKADFLLNQHCPALTARLIELAEQAKVVEAETFVNQVLILLQGALTEELRDPKSGGLNAAKIAAMSIMQNAINKPSLSTRWAYFSQGAFATLMVVFGGYLFATQIMAEANYQNTYHDSYQEVSNIDPDLIAQVRALQSEIKSGHCPAPQLFAMPQDQAAVYMDAISYRDSAHPIEDSERLTKFLVWYRQNRQWECYFPPSNGHTTVSWVGRGA
jgi:hypothetical protein